VRYFSCVYMWVCVFIFMCVLICVCVCMHVCHVCVYAWMCMHMWVCIYNMYVCVYSYMCVCVCVCVCGCITVYLCVRVGTCVSVLCVDVNSPPSLCLVASCSDSDPFLRFEPVTGDSDWCSLWTWYTSDSKVDLWNDLEIRTGSCSKGQTAIRNQNSVMPCECLFLCYSLISLFTVVDRRLYVTRIISCDHLIYFISMIICITS